LLRSGAQPPPRADIQVVKITVAQTAAGWVGLAFSARGLAELHYPLPEHEPALAALQARFPEAAALADHAWARLKGQLRDYFDGRPVAFEVPLDLAPYTPFQRAVWETTLRIPYGETRTYAWIAHEVDAPLAYRAVGAAMGANPIPIIVPCHRVLRSNGGLGGYGGGLAMKQRLLAMEKGIAITAIQELD